MRSGGCGHAPRSQAALSEKGDLVQPKYSDSRQHSGLSAREELYPPLAEEARTDEFLISMGEPHGAQGLDQRRNDGDCSHRFAFRDQLPPLGLCIPLDVSLSGGQPSVTRKLLNVSEGPSGRNDVLGTPSDEGPPMFRSRRPSLPRHCGPAASRPTYNLAMSGGVTIGFLKDLKGLGARTSDSSMRGVPK